MQFKIEKIVSNVTKHKLLILKIIISYKNRFERNANANQTPTNPRWIQDSIHRS